MNRARWLPCGGLVCAVFGLLDDCVAGVGVLVKLSRAHGGCLGIRSR
jgi:hypothetical protein